MKSFLSFNHIDYIFPFWMILIRAYLVAQRVKRLPAMQETWVWSLGWEDPLEKEMATHSSTLDWKIPRMGEPSRLQSMGSQSVGHDWVTSLFTLLQYLIDLKILQMIRISKAHLEHSLIFECLLSSTHTMGASWVPLKQTSGWIHDALFLLQSKKTYLFEPYAKKRKSSTILGSLGKGDSVCLAWTFY